MSENTVLESLNKGVPVWAPLSIRYQDLIENSNNKELLQKVITNNFEKYMEYIQSLAPVVDLSFFYTMMIIIDESTLERKLIFSPFGFISSLLYNLNYQNICKELETTPNNFISVQSHDMMEKIKNELRERIKV